MLKKISFIILSLCFLVSCGNDGEGRSANTAPQTPDDTPVNVTGSRPLFILNAGRCISTETNQEVDSLSCPSPTEYVI